MKADDVDDAKGNERDSVVEYVAEYLLFKYGVTAPKTLKSFVQTLQQNVLKPKVQDFFEISYNMSPSLCISHVSSVPSSVLL
jgi:hypothetical protein